MFERKVVLKKKKSEKSALPSLNLIFQTSKDK